MVDTQKQNKLGSTLYDIAQFDECLNFHSQPEITMASNSENDLIIGLNFEFDIDGDDENTENIDMDIFIDKVTQTASVTHPYCTNEGLLSNTATDMYRSWLAE